MYIHVLNGFVPNHEIVFESLFVYEFPMIYYPSECSISYLNNQRDSQTRVANTCLILPIHNQQGFSSELITLHKCIHTT